MKHRGDVLVAKGVLPGYGSITCGVSANLLLRKAEGARLISWQARAFETPEFMRRRQGTGLLIALVAAACQDTTSPSTTPAAVRPASSASVSATVGTPLLSPPAFTVTNERGVALADVPVTVRVTEGGGSLSDAPTRTLQGATSVGRWTLGTRAGRNALEVQVSGLAPLLIVATGIPGAPASLSAVSGDNQRGLAGAELLLPLVLQVSDQFGNGVPNLDVSLTAETPGSSLFPVQLSTGPDGRSQAVAWRLSTRKRTNSARATVTTTPSLTTSLRAEYLSDYNIDLRFVGPPSAELQRIFSDVVERVGAVLIGDVVDVPLFGFDATRCGGPVTPLTEQVDDVIIYVVVSDIDGPGKVLGAAGPCLTRTTTRHTAIGFMQFDAADVQNLISGGRFEAIVLHEMLHVIGIGTLWRSRSLLDGSGTSDPRFTGIRATSHCVTLGFSTSCGVGSVPAENTGGSGTIEVHWRESVFDAELMTGFAESTANMPLSAMSIASLEDVGYVVNVAAADPFSPPLAARFGFPRAAPDDGYDRVLMPIAEVSPAGWIRQSRQ
ncbi:MAG: leishmanolysin-related zinc metalloendopeptidase [Gemmatimonadaceae bacterium]